MFEDLSDDDSAPIVEKRTKQNTITYESDEEKTNENETNEDEEEEIKIDVHQELKDFVHNVIVTNASVDMSHLGGENEGVHKNNLDAVAEENSSLDTCIETHGLASPARSACVSPASSNGGVYSVGITGICNFCEKKNSYSKNCWKLSV